MLAAAPLLVSASATVPRFEDRVLAAHNLARLAAGLPQLSWNGELANEAGEWAEHLARSGEFDHAHFDGRGIPYGENLWAGTPDAFAPEQMIGHWLDEKVHYKAGNFPDNSQTGNVADVGHYTQIMWRSTREVGCAIARGREEVLVCRYRPGGNVIGHRPF